MIKLGETGWADFVEALGVRDGHGECRLYSNQGKETWDSLLQAKLGHGEAWAETFRPFVGQAGLLFSGGHKPEMHGLVATASYGGIYFVADADPYRHHNHDRDLPTGPEMLKRLKAGGKLNP